MGKKQAKQLKNILRVFEHYLICKETGMKRGVINKRILLKIKGRGGSGVK